MRGSAIIQSHSLTENMGPVSTTFSARRTLNSNELLKRHYKLIGHPNTITYLQHLIATRRMNQPNK